MAYKVFSNGNALNASELNTYLMNQSVMVFASTTARDAALTSPVEGMLVWLEDGNKYVKYDGSVWGDLVPVDAGRNAIINGAFEINQRNFTTTTTAGYLLFDRWFTSKGGTTGTATWTSETFTPGAAPVVGYEAKNYLRLTTTGYSNEDSYASLIQQKIEGVRSFAGQTVTFSYWAKAGSGTPKLGIRFAQYFGTGGSPSAQVDTFPTSQTIGSSWVRYSSTVTLPSISGKTIGTNNDDSLIVALIASAGSGTYGGNFGSMLQNNTFDIWGVQLEAGSVATPFKRNANSIQGELAACQRYYQRINYDSGSSYSVFAFGSASSTTSTALYQKLNEMRVRPTSVDFSAGLVLDDLVTQTSASGISIDTGRSTGSVIALTVTAASGLTQFRPYALRANNSASAFVGFSAEL